jgi:hypothetical protein
MITGGGRVCSCGARGGPGRAFASSSRSSSTSTSPSESARRLLTAVAIEPSKLGVGIDEDTAIVYYGSGEIRSSAGPGLRRRREQGDRPRPDENDPAGRFSLSGALLHVRPPAIAST